jgi:Ti-type conjugative transfer relaxase TraA
MAVYHFSAKVIQRSAGRSAIAAAAYRSASELMDERVGRSYDYTAKDGVVHSEIMLPEGAPERWLDRSILWNEVETIEHRKDAVLAREVEFALPHELSQAEGIALAQDFVRQQFVSRGMVADLNVHWTQDPDGKVKPHVHVMLSMREIDCDGFGKKQRAWNDVGLLRGWRESWADMANARLAELGHDTRIDHRSLRDQGIELEPQHKIGPAGARREDRGEDAERAAEHRAIAHRNGEALFADPSIALDALTQQHSTFTRRDIARFIDRHTDGMEQFASVLAKVEAAPELVRLGEDERGRERFTTQAMLEAERRMERAATALAGRDGHPVFQVAALRAVRVAEASGLLLGDEQKAALLHVTNGRDLALVVGFAGTGKSAMLGVARTAWETDGYRVRGAALSGIAAEGLEAGSGIASRTLASLEFAWKDGRDVLTSKDVLVVDEAGMIGSRQMERVLSAAQAAGAKVVLVGDPEQLQAIEAGAAFRALAERHGAQAITTVRRQREDWQRDATRELATGRTAEALERYGGAGMVQVANTRDAAKAALVAGWAEALEGAVRQQSPAVSQVILAYTRADVQDLNTLARKHMRASGGLRGADQVVQTERGERVFAAGDRIMFQRNERGLGGKADGHNGVAVKNGTLGMVLEVASGGERLTVQLDGAGQAGKNSRMVTFYTRDYAHIDHGYAATVHKAQGVTVDRAHVLATPHMDRHAAYVGLTRHRDGVALHYAAEDFANPARLARSLGRERVKDTTLDYDRLSGRDPDDDLVRRYAERRGLDRLHPQSEIVVRAPILEREGAQSTRSAEPVPGPTQDAGLEQVAAAGRAGFRERFEARQRQQAAQKLAQEIAQRAESARGLVGAWDGLIKAYSAALPQIEKDPTLAGTRDQLLWFGHSLELDPKVVALLRERGADFGMADRPNLARVLAAERPEQVITGLMEDSEKDMRAHLKSEAEAERIRQREERRLSRGHDRGMSPGW